MKSCSYCHRPARRRARLVTGELRHLCEAVECSERYLEEQAGNAPDFLSIGLPGPSASDKKVLN